METQSKAVAVKTCGVLPLLLRWKTANQIEQPAPPKKKSTGSLSACMAMAMLLPWRTTFFRFTSCQPRGDPAQGINMGA